MSVLQWPQMPFPKTCMGLQPKLVRGACAMGCDVRPGSWDVAIGDYVWPRPDLKVARLIFYGKVRDEVDVIFLAHQYPVAAGITDSRPDGTLAKRMVERLRRGGKDFWRAQYNTHPTNVEITENNKEKLLTLERTMTLDGVFYAVNTALGLALPQNWRDLGGRGMGEDVGAFGRELMNPTRIPDLWHGQPYDRWTEDGDDHSLHALNYMLVALQRCKLVVAGAESLMASRGRVVSTLTDAMDYEDGPGDPIMGRRARYWDGGDGGDRGPDDYPDAGVISLEA